MESTLSEHMGALVMVFVLTLVGLEAIELVAIANGRFLPLLGTAVALLLGWEYIPWVGGPQRTQDRPRDRDTPETETATPADPDALDETASEGDES